MSLWRNVRGEMAGAWRSVCYDLGRRPAGRDPQPDVTSTGMSTFPGSLVDLPGEPPRTDARPPRRFVAVTAFCALGLTGAAGSYLAATTTFAGEMAERPSAPPAVAAPLPPDEVEPVGGVAGMGAVPVARERRPRVVTKITPTSVRSTARTTAPTTRRAVTRPPTPGCDCETPPAPTPTAAPSATSAEPDISASPSASGSVSPTPDISEPSGDSDRRHRRWQR
ncbi:hypothetical protein GCM10010112_77650 [Actinoplanes lobatus]|uniref:Uncharacterized protein n=1 Tax=Actinoplanes lobatus TaxID=113568 RepID=A0A7W7HF91_9ACTN|nr:hypothetical protein [Actinoplanes lobatus]MBB4749412.1 hypothetical protein [Actinoplanes lobatus]GGN91446.1 hypothetical protein GCM10010112_77650 [Actinoplanes lobatus]GIE40353.1 hypothetical protein Alo02nite_32510 [Actinoplanes lobatus]